MLGKLLKYEFKATTRTILPAYLLIAFFTVAGRIAIKNPTINSLLNGSIAGVLMLFYVLAIIMIVALTFFMILQRFYTNLLRDEGYLTHTLPVSVDHHIWTKTITAFVWTVISTIVVTVSLFGLLAEAEDIRILITGMQEVIRAYNEICTIPLPLLIAELVILALISLLSALLNLYAAMGIGQFFNRHKILGSVLAYMGLSFIFSIAFGVFAAVAGVWFDNLAGREYIIHVVLGILSAGVVVQGVLYYFITRYCLGKRLNLE